MFPSDGTAPPDCFVKDFAEGKFNAVHFFVIAFVCEEGGMKISVAHVPERANTKTVLLSDQLDKADHVGQLASGYCGVFKNGSGRDARQGRECGASSAGEFSGFGIVFSNAHFEASMFATDFFHLRGFFGDDGGVSVRFDEQERFAIERQADVRVIFDAMDGSAIEKFKSAGNDFGRNDG